MGFTPLESPNLKQKKEAESRVKDQARANFQMWYHPDDWSMSASGEFRPTFAHISKDPGVGAVDAAGGFDAEHLRLKRAGWVEIPHDVLAGGDYVTPYKNRAGKLTHRSVFQTPYSTPQGETLWAHDEESWSKFVRLLRKRGIIKPPSVAVVAGMLASKQQELDFALRRRPAEGAPPERHEAWERKCGLLRESVRVLERERAAAVKVYGEPNPGISSQLDELLEEAAAEDDEFAELAAGLAAELTPTATDEKTPTSTPTTPTATDEKAPIAPTTAPKKTKTTTAPKKRAPVTEDLDLPPEAEEDLDLPEG